VDAPPADRALLDEATELLREAGQLTLRWFRSRDLDVDRKGDGTPVTEADRAAERYLRDEVARRHPDDAIVGEEWPDSAGTSGRTWIIDPIDGTKAFTHGVPLYSNLLAVYDQHGPLVGVINLPALDQTVFAARGLGCHDQDGPVRVSDCADLGDGSLCTSSLSPWDADAAAAVLSCGALVRTWGDGFGFAMVATGYADAMADPGAALWDVAPMPVILDEAGGRFTDALGNPVPPVDPTIVTSGVASNGLVHDQVLGLLNLGG
jgi:histidinol phosphatase-like enzyme (inositol monophosphatase family)